MQLSELMDAKNWSGEDDTLKQVDPKEEIGAGLGLVFFLAVIVVAMYVL